jgi:hypothetical protein
MASPCSPPSWATVLTLDNTARAEVEAFLKAIDADDDVQNIFAGPANQVLMVSIATLRNKRVQNYLRAEKGRSWIY